jgi:hypothetical protein
LTATSPARFREPLARGSAEREREEESSARHFEEVPWPSVTVAHQSNTATSIMTHASTGCAAEKLTHPVGERYSATRRAADAVPRPGKSQRRQRKQASTTAETWVTQCNPCVRSSLLSHLSRGHWLRAWNTSEPSPSRRKGRRQRSWAGQVPILAVPGTTLKHGRVITNASPCHRT